MKIVKQKTENELIRLCRTQNDNAQRLIYEKYSPIMRGICFRYSQSDAEDILHEGFIKVFQNIKQYSGRGSFEGWIKRIVINTAITHCKQKAKNQHYNIDEINETRIEDSDSKKDVKKNTKELLMDADFSKKDILIIVNELPEGYRLVFNLYAIEGFKHKEIAKQLDITVNTSKSQLSRARKLIQKKLVKIVDKQKSKTNQKGIFIAFLFLCKTGINSLLKTD